MALTDKQAIELAEKIDEMLDRYEPRDILEAVAEALLTRTEGMKDRASDVLNRFGTRIQAFIDKIE
ncbi:hypothetical protein L0244_18055 [bacterium]|nr:hypothetical protein [bacterium]